MSVLSSSTPLVLELLKDRISSSSAASSSAFSAVVLRRSFFTRSNSSLLCCCSSKLKLMADAAVPSSSSVSAADSDSYSAAEEDNRKIPLKNQSLRSRTYLDVRSAEELISGIQRESETGRLPKGVTAAAEEHFHYYRNAGCSLFCNGKRRVLVRATDDFVENPKPSAPLFLESAVGKKLTRILQRAPHIFFANVEKELVSLRDERDEYDNLFPPSSRKNQFRGALERYEKAKRRDVEDIMYCLIVQRFMEKNISMFSKRTLTTSDFWPLNGEKLRAVHSKGLQDMIIGQLVIMMHSILVKLRDPTLPDDEISIIESSNIDLGLLYADSVVYAHFLRSVERRFERERAFIKRSAPYTVDKFKNSSLEILQELGQKKTLRDELDDDNIEKLQKKEEHWTCSGS